MTVLELECYGELQLAWAGSNRHPGNDPRASAIDAGVSRISRIDVVENIEGIHPELSTDVLVHGSVLH